MMLHQIFALALLLSSFFIYNSVGSIDGSTRPLLAPNSWASYSLLPDPANSELPSSVRRSYAILTVLAHPVGCAGAGVL